MPCSPSRSASSAKSSTDWSGLRMITRVTGSATSSSTLCTTISPLISPSGKALLIR